MIERTRDRLAWYPLRDPKSRRWFWLRCVEVVEKRFDSFTVPGWGSHFEWQIVEVREQREGE